MDRQPLYSCLTCTDTSQTAEGASAPSAPSASSANRNVRAGVCLACSLECHDGHNLVELYTKRYSLAFVASFSFSSFHFHFELTAFLSGIKILIFN